MEVTAATSNRHCAYCGKEHPGKCPLVKSYEYHQDGTIKRVEFYAPNDYGGIVPPMPKP